jgi:hypothetical protein
LGRRTIYGITVYQYPKFPHEEAELKKELIIRTELMMIELEQKGW